MQELSPAQQKNMLVWAYESLGLMYALALPLAGLVCFCLALLIVSRGRGSMAGAALVLVVPIPLLVGLFAMLHGLCSSYAVIATAVGAPKPAEFAQAWSMALFSPLVGLLMSIPAYLVAVVGAFSRSLSPAPHGKEE